MTTNPDNAVTAVNEYATIGTITYIDSDGKFGAVGHNLDISSFSSGNIFIVPVDSVIKSNKEYFDISHNIQNINILSKAKEKC